MGEKAEGIVWYVDTRPLRPTIRPDGLDKMIANDVGTLLVSLWTVEPTWRTDWPSLLKELTKVKTGSTIWVAGWRCNGNLRRKVCEWMSVSLCCIYECICPFVCLLVWLSQCYVVLSGQAHSSENVIVCKIVGCKKSKICHISFKVFQQPASTRHNREPTKGRSETRQWPITLLFMYIFYFN